MTVRSLVMAVIAATVVAALAGPVGADGEGSVTAQVRVGSVPSPLAIDLSLSTHQVAAGQTAKGKSRVINVSDGSVADVQVTLHVSEANSAIRQPIVQIGTLRPGRGKTVAWELCSSTPGIYLIEASTTGLLGDAQVEAVSDAIALQVLPSSGRTPAKCPAW